MAILDVVTAGYGNGTFSGSIPFVVTRGYNISTIIPPVIPDADGIVIGGILGDGISVAATLGDGVSVTASLGGGIVAKGKL
jgi:hypothetical protein